MLCGSGLQLAAEEEEDDPQPLGDDGDEGTDSVPTDDSSFDVTQSEPSEGEFIRNLTSLSNNFLSTVLDLFVMKFVRKIINTHHTYTLPCHSERTSPTAPAKS